MMTRLRTWMDETHGAGSELVRHFLARFFDSDTVATAGEWQKVAIGIFAALVSVGILGVKTYMQRYNYVQVYSTAGVYHAWVRADMLSFIGVAMAVTMLLTVLEWQSLFPSLRDCLALAGQPVSARQIFQAKFGALVLLFAAFVLATAPLPAALFTAVISGRWQENPSALVIAAANFCAIAGACVFVFFGLLAVQGILLNVLPGRIFARVSLIVQAALFVATLGALPLLGRQPAAAAWWPPLWFVRLWESMVVGPPGAARAAVLAMVLPPIVSVAAYLLSYHRYRRLLLEAPPDRPARWTGIGSWLLDRWIADPHQQAAFSFIWKTLARSRSHRLVLLAYAGIALGWITKGALDTPPPSLHNQGMYGLLTVLAPLALSMLVTIGLRYVFSLPVTLPANWVFQTLDREGRTAWLAAVERFVLWFGVTPVFVAGLPATIAILGWVRASAATALTFLAALLWFETMFRQWRKLPFTCSYLPGKKPMWAILARYGAAVPFLAPAGQLILSSSGVLTAFAALFSFEAGLWWRLRNGRRSAWSQCDLVYDEAPEAPVMALGLRADESDPARSAPSAASNQPAREMFSGTLVASRGLLPQSWAEEIAEDRSHPSLLFETFLADVRYGGRLIARSPVLSAVVILTLTVGIGINASVFAVVNGLALLPHVYRDPDRFVRLVPRARLSETTRRVTYAEYQSYRDHSRSVRQLAAYSYFIAFVGQDDSAGSIGMAVSCNFFVVDGLDRPLQGRLFNADDCRPGQAPPIVINEALWHARFASDPRVIGRSVEVNNRPAIIVGVVPNRTAGWTRPASLWLPYTAHLYIDPMGNLYGDDEQWLALAGRLAPGFSRSDAGAEIEVLARQYDRLHPGRNTAIVTTDGSWLRELELTVTGRNLMLIAFFLGAFNLVLFISCANVATLLLARATARRREIAVRLSLGAPRIRLVRMLVTESLLLAAVAGAASIVLAFRLPDPIFRIVAERAPDFPMPVDWHTFGYVATVVLLSGVLAGLAPALESVKVDLTGSLKGGVPTGRGTIGTRRLEGLLVSAQVAMSMVLLVGAALFARSEERTLRADPGYLPQKVVVAPLYFTDDTTLAKAADRVPAIVHRISMLPGVRGVAFSDGIPMFEHTTVELTPPGRPDASQPVDVFTGSPGFFQTLGVPLLRGREFQPGEASSVVVSWSLAWAFWPRQDPIGKVVQLPEGAVTVVGVARDVDPLRFGGTENPVLYKPWRLHAIHNVMSVRFDSGASSGGAVVRAALREMDPNLFVTAIRLQTWIDQVTEVLWNVVGLIVILGLVATLLATTGIYGAVSFAVTQRTKELGIRVALGAQRLDIIRDVFVSGGKPVLKGLLAGLWLSAAVAAGLRQSVEGSPLRLDSANPLLYAGAAFLLAAAALLAMLAPAHRGAGADPLEALRCE